MSAACDLYDQTQDWAPTRRAMIKGNSWWEQENQVNVHKLGHKKTFSPNVSQLTRWKFDYSVKPQTACPSVCGVCCYWTAAPLHHLGVRFQYRTVTSTPFPFVVLAFPSFSQFPHRSLTLSLGVMSGTTLCKFIFHHASAYTGVNESLILSFRRVGFVKCCSKLRKIRIKTKPFTLFKGFF